MRERLIFTSYGDLRFLGGPLLLTMHQGGPGFFWPVIGDLEIFSLPQSEGPGSFCIGHDK